jgi:hypothetical protein
MPRESLFSLLTAREGIRGRLLEAIDDEEEM